MKVGTQTSEFWLSLAMLVAATFLVTLGKISGADWLGVSAVTTGVYTGSRAVVKATSGGSASS